MLAVKALHKRLGGRAVLAGAALSCGPGDVAVVMGENGAGKSTLLRAIAGVLAPDRGDVVIRGCSMRADAARAKHHVGYAPDATDAFPDLLAGELLALVWSLKSARTADVHLDRLGITPLLRQKMSALSFGQRKRVLIAAALAGEPALLVLDEPSNGIDPEGASCIVSLLAERRAAGLATILSTNDAAFAAMIGGTRWVIERGEVNRRA